MRVLVAVPVSNTRGVVSRVKRLDGVAYDLKVCPVVRRFSGVRELGFGLAKRFSAAFACSEMPIKGLHQFATGPIVNVPQSRDHTLCSGFDERVDNARRTGFVCRSDRGLAGAERH